MGKAVTPEAEETPPGAKYVFRNTGAGRGEILGPSGKPLWRYAPPPSWLNFLNGPLRGPDLVLSALDGAVILTVHRERSFPSALFEIVADYKTLGTIENTSILSTFYSARFTNGASWMFKIPAFTVDFEGRSDAGGAVRIHLESELVWSVLVDEGQESPELLASLALMHSERCRW